MPNNIFAIFRIQEFVSVADESGDERQVSLPWWHAENCRRVFPRKEPCMAQINKSTDSSSLAEVVDRILDKGIVIDAFAKVSLVGIELLSIEARVVIASVETYLKYAEAIGLTASAATPA
jgi:hypothetical protein